MILELSPLTSESEQFELIRRLQQMGFQISRQGQQRLAIVKGMDKLVRPDFFIALPHVLRVLPLKEKFKLASKAVKSEPTVIEIKGKRIGGGELFVIAGPCSIESLEQIEECAKITTAMGAQGLRGGAFKPRTSPYEFQGMGEEGLKILRDAAEKYNLVSVSEVMDASQIDLASKYVDILQVGARNMHNFSLLKELGRVKNPILLKRGFAATYQDLLLSAEYIISAGNPNVILCERGIRTFETYTRNTLDLNAVPALKELTHLPVLVDPSHGTGQRSMVVPMARASIAAGADGVIVEIHPQPDQAVTDAQQTLGFNAFSKMMAELKIIHNAIKALEAC